MKDGVFSAWKGQRPFWIVPARLSATVSPTTSATGSFALMSATMPEEEVMVAALARSEHGCQVLCQGTRAYSTRLSSFSPLWRAGFRFGSHVSTLPSTAPDLTRSHVGHGPRLATRPIARLDRRGDAGRIPRAARTAPPRVRAAPHPRRSSGGRATRLRSARRRGRARRRAPPSRAGCGMAAEPGGRAGSSRCGPNASIRGRCSPWAWTSRWSSRSGHWAGLNGPHSSRPPSSAWTGATSPRSSGATGSSLDRLLRRARERLIRAYADAATEPPEGPIASHVQSLARRAMG